MSSKSTAPTNQFHTACSHHIKDHLQESNGDHGSTNAEEQEIDRQAAGHAEERLALLPTGRVAHGRSIRTGLTMNKVRMRSIRIMCIERNMVLMRSFLA